MFLRITLITICALLISTGFPLVGVAEPPSEEALGACARGITEFGHGPYDQSTFPDISFRIAMDVQAELTIEGEIKSYLARELRSLGDVTLVERDLTIDPDWDWELSIVALVNNNKYGDVVGFTISMVILETFTNKDLVGAVSFLHIYEEELSPEFETGLTSYFEGSLSSLNESQEKFLRGFNELQGLYHFKQNYLTCGAMDDLKHICESLIADFDSDYLEPERISHQEIKDMLPQKP